MINCAGLSSIQKIQQTRDLYEQSRHAITNDDQAAWSVSLDVLQLTTSTLLSKRVDSFSPPLAARRLLLLLLWQLYRNITFHTIRQQSSVAMGTAGWDLIPPVVWEASFATRPRADFRVFMCAVTQQLPPPGRGHVGVRLLCKTWNSFFPSSQFGDNTAFIPHQRLVLFLRR